MRIASFFQANALSSFHSRCWFDYDNEVRSNRIDPIDRIPLSSNGSIIPFLSEPTYEKPIATRSGRPMLELD